MANWTFYQPPKWPFFCRPNGMMLVEKSGESLCLNVPSKHPFIRHPWASILRVLFTVENQWSTSKILTKKYISCVCSFITLFSRDVFGFAELFSTGVLYMDLGKHLSAFLMYCFMSFSQEGNKSLTNFPLKYSTNLDSDHASMIQLRISS